jgi:ankyrin repeat protein
MLPRNHQKIIAGTLGVHEEVDCEDGGGGYEVLPRPGSRRTPAPPPTTQPSAEELALIRQRQDLERLRQKERAELSTYREEAEVSLRQHQQAVDTAAQGYAGGHIAPPSIVDAQANVRLLWDGGYLWKIPFKSNKPPHRRWFQAVQSRPSDPLMLEWRDPRNPLEKARCITLADVQEVRRGQKTDAFWRQVEARGAGSLPDQALCFSLVTHDRTVDVAAASPSIANAWISSLQHVIFDTGAPPPPLQHAAPPPPPMAQPTSTPASQMLPGETTKDFWTRTLFAHVRGNELQEVTPTQYALHEYALHQSALHQYALHQYTHRMLSQTGHALNCCTLTNRCALSRAICHIQVSEMFASECPVDLFEPQTGETALLIACRMDHADIGRPLLITVNTSAHSQACLHCSPPSLSSLSLLTLSPSLTLSPPSPPSPLLSSLSSPLPPPPTPSLPLSAVELCLSWGAKNDPHPHFGQTALQAAVCANNAECAHLLLATAALSDMDHVIVNHEDHSAARDAPLHTASHQGDISCVELLLNHGADAMLVDAHGRTPLHRAAQNGHTECVGYLLDNGGENAIDRGDHQGNTPLHHATLNGQLSAVQLLLETAASANAVNSDGNTPYQIAVTNSHTECASLLHQYEDQESRLFTRCLKPGESAPDDPLRIPGALGTQPSMMGGMQPPLMGRSQSLGAVSGSQTARAPMNHHSGAMAGSQTARLSSDDHSTYSTSHHAGTTPTTCPCVHFSHHSSSHHSLIPTTHSLPPPQPTPL